MRCECCDKILTDGEASSKFTTAPGEPVRYTQMCTVCEEFLPKSVRVMRKPTSKVPDEVEDLFDYTNDDLYLDPNE